MRQRPLFTCTHHALSCFPAYGGVILHGEDFPRTLMRGSPDGAVEPCSPLPGDTRPGCVARVGDFAISLGRPVCQCTGLKKMKGLAPVPAICSPSCVMLA